MHWWPCLLLLLGCVGSSPAPTPPVATSKTPIGVLSFNIRYGSATDGPDAWPLRRESVAQLLVTSHAAWIGVQEALDFQLEYLDSVLVHHRRVGQGREGGTRGEHAAIYYDTRRFELLQSEDRWLSETPERAGSVGWDAALTRIATHAVLRERASGKEWSVWNTHFDHRGSRARTESARLLVQWIQTDQRPTVLMGDLNAGEDSAPLRLLRSAGLQDTFRTIHPQRAEVGTFHGFRGGSVGDKIDYVLVDNRSETLDANIIDSRGAHGRWPSDHHAVHALLMPTD
jgi:endonuclease/exonuclease/phosphatase family metal-dependent hydrolase